MTLMTQFRGWKVKHSPGWEFWCRTACVFHRDVNVWWLPYHDLEAESSGLLFKSPLAGGSGILCWPHYRLHKSLDTACGVRETVCVPILRLQSR